MAFAVLILMRLEKQTSQKYNWSVYQMADFSQNQFHENYSAKKSFFKLENIELGKYPNLLICLKNITVCLRWFNERIL